MLGALGRRGARQLVKLVAQAHQVSSRELIALGDGTAELGTIDRFDFADLPEEVRQHAFLA
jgi:hypothetical protein